MKQPSHTSLGDNLHNMRLAARLTQLDVARHIGVDTSMISIWETSRLIPNEHYKALLFDFFVNRVKIKLPSDSVIVNPYDVPRPTDIITIHYTELSARSPMGFRYASAFAPELLEVFNENVKDMGETVGAEIYKQFN